MQAKVSVVVPVFNTESYLQKCLDSISAQTLEGIEIVVVDDGSSDDCPNMIAEYEKQEPRVKVIRQPNFGLAAARNQGIEAAEGAYIAFVDSDDYVHPEMLQKLYERAVLERSDIVICQFQQVTGDGEVLQTSSIQRQPICDDYFKLILASKESSMACDKLICRKLFTRNGIRFPVGLLHEDVPTIFQLFYFAESIAVVEEPLYSWVRRDGSISRSISKKHVLDFFEGFILTREFLEKHNVLEQYWVFFTRRVVHFSLGMINRLRSQPDSQEVAKLVNLIHQWMSVLGVTSKSSIEELRSYDRNLCNQYVKETTDGVSPVELEVVETRRRLQRVEKELAEIKQTNGYRLLRKFDSFVDSAFPEGSRRRIWLQRIVASISQ